MCNLGLGAVALVEQSLHLDARALAHGRDHQFHEHAREHDQMLKRHGHEHDDAPLARLRLRGALLAALARELLRLIFGEPRLA